jgi:hypothetical protein
MSLGIELFHISFMSLDLFLSFLFVSVAADPVLVISVVVTGPTAGFLPMKTEHGLPILGKLSFL